MTTIDEIITNGVNFNLFYSNGNKSGYIPFSKMIELFIRVDFTKAAIQIKPNSLVINYDSAIKLVNKLERKFNNNGYTISSHIINDDNQAKFDVFGDSQIIISKK